MHRQKTRRTRLLAALRPWAPRLRPRPVWLSMVGLACVSAAAFTIALPLGLLVAGVACWVAEWRITS